MPAPTLDAVLACPSLPSLPAVAIQVLELTRKSDVQINEIATVVQNDPALCAKILKTVNSSFYALSKPCPTIRRAIGYLGLSTVKSLVLGFSLVEATNSTDDDFDLTDYWQRCLYAAAAARRLASAWGGCDPEEAFVAALMQDVGMLAIHALARTDYAHVLGQSKGDHRRVPRIEQEHYGFDHTQVGAELGRRWRLPEQLVDAIEQHHGNQTGPHIELVRCVSLGFKAATAITLPNPLAVLAELDRNAAEWFGMSSAVVKQLLQNVNDDAKELSGLFKVSMGEGPDINRILAEAEDASLNHQLATQMEAQTLRETNTALARQATTDGLTGVGNRKLFDEELARAFEESRTSGEPLGLIIGDADRFKLLNDNYGHQVGDAVLVELARRLSETVRGGDIVCRYGGEEFGMILPGAALQHVASIAERMRIAIDSVPFDMTGVPGGTEPLTVTSSFGAAVFCAETAHILSTPGLLIKATDRALYAAKESGRNCVRVFRANRSAAA